jgi:hypothetical protein
VDYIANIIGMEKCICIASILSMYRWVCIDTIIGALVEGSEHTVFFRVKMVLCTQYLRHAYRSLYRQHYTRIERGLYSRYYRRVQKPMWPMF